MYIGCETFEAGCTYRAGIVTRVRFIHFSYKQGGIGALVRKIRSNAENTMVVVRNSFFEIPDKPLKIINHNDFSVNNDK